MTPAIESCWAAASIAKISLGHLESGACHIVLTSRPSRLFVPLNTQQSLEPVTLLFLSHRDRPYPSGKRRPKHAKTL